MSRLKPWTGLIFAISWAQGAAGGRRHSMGGFGTLDAQSFFFYLGWINQGFYISYFFVRWFGKSSDWPECLKVKAAWSWWFLVHMVTILGHNWEGAPRCDGWLRGGKPYWKVVLLACWSGRPGFFKSGFTKQRLQDVSRGYSCKLALEFEVNKNQKMGETTKAKHLRQLEVLLCMGIKSPQLRPEMQDVFKYRASTGTWSLLEKWGAGKQTQTCK